MKQLFLDTNVVIDFLANRSPFAADAAYLFDAAVQGKCKLYISALSYSNFAYILKKLLSPSAIVQLLKELEAISEIADVNASVIQKALQAGIKDFEDAIQYCSALAVGNIDVLVTRDTKDFKNSSLSIMTPDEALAFLSTH